MGRPTACSSGRPTTVLRGPVEEEDAPLRVQEDHPVLELIDHLLQVRLLAEGGQAIGLQLAAEARELGGELLELVAAHHRGRLQRLAPADAVDLAHDGADGPHGELGEHHGGEPGERQSIAVIAASGSADRLASCSCLTWGPSRKLRRRYTDW